LASSFEPHFFQTHRWLKLPKTQPKPKKKLRYLRAFWTVASAKSEVIANGTRAGYEKNEWKRPNQLLKPPELAGFQIFVRIGSDMAVKLSEREATLGG